MLVDVFHHGPGNQEFFQALACCGDFGSPTAWPDSLPLFSHYAMLLSIGQTALPYTLLSSDALPPRWILPWYTLREAKSYPGRRTGRCTTSTSS